MQILLKGTRSDRATIRDAYKAEGSDAFGVFTFQPDITYFEAKSKAELTKYIASLDTARTTSLKIPMLTVAEEFHTILPNLLFSRDGLQELIEVPLPNENMIQLVFVYVFGVGNRSVTRHLNPFSSQFEQLWEDFNDNKFTYYGDLRYEEHYAFLTNWDGIMCDYTIASVHHKFDELLTFNHNQLTFLGSSKDSFIDAEYDAWKQAKQYRRLLTHKCDIVSYKKDIHMNDRYTTILYLSCK